MYVLIVSSEMELLHIWLSMSNCSNRCYKLQELQEVKVFFSLSKLLIVKLLFEMGHISGVNIAAVGFILELCLSL